MARTDTLPHFLTDVANAIRTKGGTSGTIQASSFDTAIANLPSGSGGDLNMDYMFSQNYIVNVYFNNQTQVPVSSMSHTFEDCSSLETVDFSGLDTTGCTDFSYCFYGCYAFTGVSTGDNIDTDSATTMEHMFDACGYLTESYISLSDTSSVTDMSYMFSGCSGLVDITNLGLDTSSVEIADNMFDSCSSLEDIPVFDLSSATSLHDMFVNCGSFSTTSLDNILQSCISVGSDYQGEKTLAEIGLDLYTYDQATIEALDHYADFVDAGWSTGYEGGNEE